MVHVEQEGIMILKYLLAFAFGGGLCLIGEIFICRTKLTPARILVGFVVVGAVLSAVGVYQPLVDIFGAGATVPLTGFGHSVVQATKEAVQKYGLAGVFSGGITGASAGMAAAVVFAAVAALFSKPKNKELQKMPKTRATKG